MLRFDEGYSMGFIKDLKDVLRGIRRSKAGIKVCPRCGSSKLHLSSRFDFWLFPQQYVCEKCGYVGPIVLEIKPEKQESNK